jgi:hypothetical protein
VTYDESGNVIPDPTPTPVVGEEGTFGGAIWAFFHPGQVQQEYAAAGQPIPPATDIMSGAVADAETHAAAAVTTGVQNLAMAGRLIAAGVLVLAGVYIYHELTKGR